MKNVEISAVFELPAWAELRAIYFHEPRLSVLEERRRFKRLLRRPRTRYTFSEEGKEPIVVEVPFD